MNFDDVEHFLEEILSGLKARKEIEPLRKKNSELQEKISATEKRFDELLAEKKLLEKNFDYLKIERDDLKSQLENVRVKYDKKLSELQEKFSAAESEAKFYRESFGELDDVFKIFSALDEETHFNLAGVFGEGKNATEFFSGAVQENHIAPFWDYVSRHVEDENFDELCKLFDFCFEMFNKGFREPPFIRLNVAEGSFFDDEIMRRTPSSPQIGNVRKILLQGYKYRVGNVVKPSVVEIQ